ncbi:MAG: hypothetical protein AAGD11_11515 [Planctomycetota bacterium]
MAQDIHKVARRLRLESLESRHLLSANPGTSVGDYNDDLFVTGADFLQWQRDFGTVAVGHATDGDGSGAVDAGDLTVWQTNHGQIDRTQPDVVGSSAERVAGQNSSTLSLTFSRSVEFATDSTAFLSELTISAQAANPAFNGGTNGEPEFVTVTINGTAASISGDGLTLSVTTDLATPAGTNLSIDPGALAFNIREVGISLESVDAISNTIATSDVSDAEFILAFRGDTGFRVTNGSLVAGSPDATPPAILDDHISVAEGSSRLNHILNLRLNAGQINATEQTYANNLYNSAELISVVPDNNLRASLISTIGSPAEQALNVVLQGRNTGVTAPAGSIFEGASSGNTLIKEVIIDPALNSSTRTAEARLNPDNTATIAIQQLFQGESIGVLAGLLVHETLVHSSDNAVGVNGFNEEIFATAADARTYLDYVSLDPSIAQIDSSATQIANANAVIFLNSGSSGTAGGFGVAPLRGDSTDILGFPSPAPQQGFEDLNRFILDALTSLEDVTTPISSFIASYISDFSGGVVSVPATFDSSFFSTLDQTNTGVSAEQAVAFAQAIGLSIAPPPAP